MKRKRTFLIFVLPIFFLGPQIGSPLSWAQPIRALLSWNLKPYWDFIEGFQKFYPLQTPVILTDAFRPLNKKEETIWLAVGHRAFSKLYGKVDKIIAGLILSPDYLPDSKDILCGLYLQIPPDILWPKIKEALPSQYKDQKITLGIPYSSKHNKNYIKQFIDYTQRSEIKIFSQHLSKNWRKEFSFLCRKSDLILFILDPFLNSEETIKTLIKIAFLFKKPTIGYNSFFLKSGASMVFQIDYFRSGEKLAKEISTLKYNQHCQWIPADFKIIKNKTQFKFLFYNENKHKDLKNYK